MRVVCPHCQGEGTVSRAANFFCDESGVSDMDKEAWHWRQTQSAVAKEDEEPIT